jgi:hypothetical protein
MPISWLAAVARCPTAAGCPRGRRFWQASLQLIDPSDPRNDPITDLALAPRKATGKVEYSMDVYLLKPVDMSRASGKRFYEGNNRGLKLATAVIDTVSGIFLGNVPTRPTDAGERVSVIRPAPCPTGASRPSPGSHLRAFCGRRGRETVEQTLEVGPALLRLDPLPLEPFHPAIHGGRDLDARHDRTHDSLRRARDQAPAPRRERRYDGYERDPEKDGDAARGQARACAVPLQSRPVATQAAGRETFACQL